MSGTGIRLENVTRDYPIPGGVRPAIEPVNLEIAPGEFVCIIGPSGCGKTTLLNVMSGLDKEYGGTVSFSGQPPVSSYMFQESRLLPWLSIRDNLAFVLEGSGADKDARIEEWLGRVGLAGYGKDFPYQLSIGMQQRAAVARALIVRPTILFMDEPFSALDELTALKVRGELLELAADINCTVVMVTHNPVEAVYLADRLVIMRGQPGWIDAQMDLSYLRRPRDASSTEIWQKSREAVALLTG